MKMHKVSILWGVTPDVGDEATTYSFVTKGELTAFLEGVEEGNGWMDWELVEEGYVVPEEDDDE